MPTCSPGFLSCFFQLNYVRVPLKRAGLSAGLPCCVFLVSFSSILSVYHSSVPVCPPDYPVVSSITILYADHLQRAGLSAGILFSFSSILYADRLKLACLSAGRPFLRARCSSAVRLDSLLVPSFLRSVPAKSTVCAPPQGVFMRCVLHANEAHNLL